MNRLILIQHCQSEHHVNGLCGGWTDTPLTELGRSQAAAIAARLANDLVDTPCRLYSSDLKRAAETAEILGRELDLVPQFMPGLRECNGGSATGKTRQWARENTSPDLAQCLFDCHPWPDAESWREFYSRVASCMARLSDEHDEELLPIIVTHGGALLNIVVWWLGIPLDDLPERTPFTASPGSISILKANRPHSIAIERLNDVSHLAKGLHSENLDMFKRG